MERRPRRGHARVAELADALDLGSSAQKWAWGFKSPLSHHTNSFLHPATQKRALRRGSAGTAPMLPQRRASTKLPACSAGRQPCCGAYGRISKN